jgi:cytochrome P450
MCLGINLAWAELRLGFAHVFRKFDLAPAHELYVDKLQILGSCRANDA